VRRNFRMKLMNMVQKVMVHLKRDRSMKECWVDSMKSKNKVVSTWTSRTSFKCFQLTKCWMKKQWIRYVAVLCWTQMSWSIFFQLTTTFLDKSISSKMKVSSKSNKCMSSSRHWIKNSKKRCLTSRKSLIRW